MAKFWLRKIEGNEIYRNEFTLVAYQNDDIKDEHIGMHGRIALYLFVHEHDAKRQNYFPFFSNFVKKATNL